MNLRFEIRRGSKLPESMLVTIRWIWEPLLENTIVSGSFPVGFPSEVGGLVVGRYQAPSIFVVSETPRPIERTMTPATGLFRRSRTFPLRYRPWGMWPESIEASDRAEGARGSSAGAMTLVFSQEDKTLKTKEAATKPESRECEGRGYMKETIEFRRERRISMKTKSLAAGLGGHLHRCPTLPGFGLKPPGYHPVRASSCPGGSGCPGEPSSILLPCHRLHHRPRCPGRS